MKIFLGGTCNNSTWRDWVIPELDRLQIPYFNPVVEDWTPECQAEEERRKEECCIHLYVITPEMTGVFSIAEAVDSAWQSGKHCLFYVVQDRLRFSKGQLRSLRAVEDLIIKRGGTARTIYGLNLLKNEITKEYKKLIN